MIKIQFQINIQVCNIPTSIAIAMMDMFESKEDDDVGRDFFQSSMGMVFESIYMYEIYIAHVLILGTITTSFHLFIKLLQAHQL